MAEVPESIRGAVASELDALLRGDRPEHLVWVREYRESGAVLVEQRPAIWTHQYTDAVATTAGGWHVIVPLWTEDEQPSDLSAEFLVDPEGRATLSGVRVL